MSWICVTSNYINFRIVLWIKTRKSDNPIWKLFSSKFSVIIYSTNKIWWKKYKNRMITYDTFMEKSHYFERICDVSRWKGEPTSSKNCNFFQTEDRDARKSSHVSRVSRVIMIFFSFRNRTECFTIVANRRNHVRTPTSFQREVYFSHDVRVERSCFLSVTRNTEKEVFKLPEKHFW